MNSPTHNRHTFFASAVAKPSTIDRSQCSHVSKSGRRSARGGPVSDPHRTPAPAVIGLTDFVTTSWL